MKSDNSHLYLANFLSEACTIVEYVLFVRKIFYKKEENHEWGIEDKEKKYIEFSIYSKCKKKIKLVIDLKLFFLENNFHIRLTDYSNTKKQVNLFKKRLIWVIIS